MKRYWLFFKKQLRPLYALWVRLPKFLRIFLLILLLASYVYYLIHTPTTTRRAPENISHPVATSQTKNGTLEKGTPEYKTFVPSGKTIDDLGGWTRVSPTGSSPVYAYVDSISGVAIQVSQQPLPNDFKKNVAEKVAELAKAYQADHIITLTTTKVYIGTSTKGPQSVIFTKDQTLILIKSSTLLTDDQWTGYIQSLR